MAGDASFEVEIEYRVNPRRRVITGARGYRVGGGRADRIATSGQAAPSERLLAGKGSYALVGGLGILLCWRAIKGYARCYVNLSLSLLRRAMFTMKNAAADISIYRRRNNCIAAMTGARDS